MKDRLFVLATELRDDDRTILEAIEKLGSVTTADAGRIVYRFRHQRCGLTRVAKTRMASDGLRALRRLERSGLVVRRRRVGWVRAQGRLA